MKKLLLSFLIIISISGEIWSAGRILFLEKGISRSVTSLRSLQKLERGARPFSFPRPLPKVSQRYLSSSVLLLEVDSPPLSIRNHNVRGFSSVPDHEPSTTSTTEAPRGETWDEDKIEKFFEEYLTNCRSHRLRERKINRLKETLWSHLPGNEAKRTEVYESLSKQLEALYIDHIHHLNELSHPYVPFSSKRSAQYGAGILGVEGAWIKITQASQIDLVDSILAINALTGIPDATIVGIILGSPFALGTLIEIYQWTSKNNFRGIGRHFFPSFIQARRSTIDEGELQIISNQAHLTALL
jgi:hypothetical protein